jgi:NAD(P)-dependent dehydrogenase (short-subunit alcohol dehydrogenase family)
MLSNDDQKAIFITGGSSGLGRATAQLFAAKEWKVIASMRIPDKEKELAKTSGVTLMALDITEPQQIERVVQEVVGSGGVDVVFNNAGYGPAGALDGLTEERILRMVNTNMLGAIRTTKAFISTFSELRELVCSSIRRRLATPDGSFQLHLSRDEMGA